MLTCRATPGHQPRGRTAGAVALLAVVPLGAAIGAVLPDPREALALITLPGRGPAGKNEEAGREAH
ncbi:hypothetical protein [Streptomyces anulatus]|uniref:hypothetical protein n=1 Tax=Streptomyces anulatus TaxID=1892 RepID=UPI00099E4468|nr:hypothetical protein [Streptomyces sp. HB372]